MPAIVTWDGGGGDFDWDNQFNWSTDTLPGDADDVVINVAGAITVARNSATDTIKSLSCAENLNLLGGTLNISNASNIDGTLTLSSGRLNAIAGMDLNGLFVWQGGELAGAGVIDANGGVNLATGAVKVLTGATLRLNLGATWNAGDLGMDEGAILEVPVGQTFQATSNNSFFRSSGIGDATVSVLGTFEKSIGTGTTTVFATIGFNVSGNANIVTGTFSLSSTGTHSGDFTLAAGTTLEFIDGANTFDPASSVGGAGNVAVAGGSITVLGNFAPTGTVTISSGAATFDAVTTLTTLVITGGTLDGTQDVTVTGATTWSDGVIGGSGEFNASGGITLDTTSTKRLLGRTFVFANNATWTGGNLAMDEGAILEVPTGQTMNPQSNNSITRQSGIGTANVQVNGTFSKSVGVGTTSVSPGVGFSNAGLVEVLSGTLLLPDGGNHTGTFFVAAGATLEFSGGTHVLGPTSSVAGPGNVTVSGCTTIVDGSFNFGGLLTISSGTLELNVNTVVSALNLNGSIAGTGDITVTGPMNWTGSGIVEGSGAINANGGLTLFTSGQPTLRGRTVTLNANAVWTGGSFLNLADNATLVIAAGVVLDAQSNAGIGIGNGSPPAFLQNYGTIRKSGGSGFTQIGFLVDFQNSGVVEALAGTILIAADGTHSGTFTAAAGKAIDFSNGTHVFTASSVLTGAGSIKFSGATATISGTFSATGPASISGDVSFSTPVNFTTVSIGSGTTTFAAAATAVTLNVSGDIAGAGSIVVSGLMSWNVGTLYGSGAVTANGGLALNTQSTPTLKNRTLTLNANSTWTGSSFLALADNATVVISPGVVFDAQSNAGFNVANGFPPVFVQNNGIFRKSVGVGTTTINAGITFTNNGTIEVQTGTFAIAANLTNFTGTTLTGGAFNVTGILTFQGANIVTNAAAISLNGTSSAINAFGGFVSALTNFANNAPTGSFTLSGSRNFSAAGAFANAGAVTINTGSSFSTAAGNYTQASGTTTVLGTLDPAGSLALQGGVLFGSGNVLGPINVSGSGVISPGSSPGIFNATGNVGFASGGTLSVEINGTAVGLQYDQLNVLGTINVSGSNLTVSRGFTPMPGQEFIIVNNDGVDAVVGNFVGYAEGATVAAAGVNFTISYVGGTGNDIVLTAAATDVVAPTIVGVFFDGTGWSNSFRTAAGNSTYGYPAQTAAFQLTTMPWSTINTIYVQFSENVAVDISDLGIRGLNVTVYPVTSFGYDSVNFVAKWTISVAFDTDRVILDLDGDSGAAVADAAGNKLAGTWTEAVSGFPTGGAAGVDFKFRFVVAVGDVDRNSLVRNADLNLVRANLFTDAGQAGYSIFRDIDGNGLTRNVDLNTVRGHLFVDPPAGPGPLRGGRSGNHRRGPLGFAELNAGRFHKSSTAEQSDSPKLRRPMRSISAPLLDSVFGEM